jgi:Ni,Fe-hydrogenase III large subunit
MEIAESIRLIRSLLDALPDGAIAAPLPPESGEGIGFAEGVRGDIWHWLRLDHGLIASVFMRDPAWAHWPLLEAVAAGGQAEDLPVTLASFGLSSSGVDL